MPESSQIANVNHSVWRRSYQFPRRGHQVVTKVTAAITSCGHVSRIQRAVQWTHDRVDGDRDGTDIVEYPLEDRDVSWTSARTTTSSPTLYRTKYTFIRFTLYNPLDVEEGGEGVKQVCEQ